MLISSIPQFIHACYRLSTGTGSLLACSSFADVTPHHVWPKQHEKPGRKPGVLDIPFKRAAIVSGIVSH
ncbi:hypothetical protein ACAF76_020675 [Brevibacillus sp. TJ4]|uniref:hypothetical protein n=1 Tax=Brevibacillus sp. TJ4 TaxID=3234853 RepID=UPI0037D9612C